jgi:hypothetical protein
MWKAHRIVNLHPPLGHGAEYRAVVQLLEGLAPQRTARHLADEEQQRCGVLVRDMHACRRIGGAGSARYKAHTGPPGQFALGLGHHGRAAFLAAHRDGNRCRFCRNSVAQL